MQQSAYLDDRREVAQAIAEVCHADGRVSEMEAQYFNGIVASLQLSAAELMLLHSARVRGLVVGSTKPCPRVDGYQWRHLLPNKNPTKPLIDLVGRLALLRE